jgi:tRNA(fMet)-specific endonuclease VapC
MLFLLDTDTVVDVIRRQVVVARKLAMVSPADVAVSAMTVAELVFGAMVSSNAFRRTQDTTRFLEKVAVIPFDERMAREHAQIRATLRRTPIGHSDMVIAATAVVSSRVLVTSNLREFSRVPGLRVVSWR